MPINKKLSATFVCSCLSLLGLAQNDPADSVQTLGEVMVRAFGQNRQLKTTAAAVNYTGPAQLARFNNISVLPALNSTPGVRMEERSPGSYRMNIRGSTLRSPFGIRNVKVYWDGIPLTDPGGNTYLNQLSYYNFHSIEVIKGPGSSLYGAGTGGVILINSQAPTWLPGIEAGYGAGSFGLHNLNVQIRLGKDQQRNSFGYTHQTSDGYRDHTNMRRDIATWQTRIRAGDKQQVNIAVLYGDLYYQTPGALTKAEYIANPRAARPAAGALPGAGQAKAAIYQKTFLAGVNNDYHFSEHFHNTFILYGAFSQIKNPTFRNYERRTEPHFGGRTVFSWDRPLTGGGSVQLLWGGEVQKGFFNTKTFANLDGSPGATMTDDDINNWTYTAFAQTDWQLPDDWNITAGFSINRSSVTITRLSVPGFVPVKRTYHNQWAPRIALAKKIILDCWVYGSFSRGFSPPTVQEILPSTSVISTGLEAEKGNNYELGLKSSWAQRRLYIEINAFRYRLHDAIVQRKDASNADYFVNAGSTRQRGIESQAYYRLFQKQGFINEGRIWISHTWNDFHYRNFKQSITDYSGNRLPSVAKHTVAAGIDLSTRSGLYTRLMYFYSDPVALNDANTDYAASYNLLGGRVGWKKSIKKINLDLFAGADNLFDVKYSLGNDINAAGNRYYNAAPGRNYFAGITLQWIKEKSD